ncbi:MAG: helix-turn-helix domain-containing protein [Dehalococcoidia bacterium]
MTTAQSSLVSAVARGSSPAIAERIGHELRRLRVGRELSQSELTRRAGMLTQASLSNYENGKRLVPLDTLIRLAEALQVDLDVLIDAGVRAHDQGGAR